MSYYYSRTLNIPFEDVVQKITLNLQQQGFGIITTIDLNETLKQKLAIDFRKYKILGACNPQFAYKAVSIDSHMGLMLPCNIVIQEHENNTVEVSAVNPTETIPLIATSTQLRELASDVSDHLRTAIDNLHYDQPTQQHAEALPTVRTSQNENIPIQG
ncbi:DUF302 domain-containing protein [Ohtaekwangia koreensis]|uniref:Uncharacterized conserved protein, DUF302 family n=1 Tax=Ohtaekwangia koreensis TaxID=688867 RepID=A0A1T5M6I3_9BACT|nr:DUF302 domain-containing protein [Ohtaekwangia koreensis]SKC83448.1 Uncharacterized conserved protein, DUF302 family [Ohtaekwangia koreensis]